MIDGRFTSGEVCHLALVTARQLQWWDEQGILSPMQDRGRRMYTAHELFGAMLYRELSERGFSTQAFGRIWKQIKTQGVALRRDALQAAKRWLLTDGDRVVFLEHADVVLAFLEQRRSPAFVLIPLAPMLARIEAALSKAAVREDATPVRMGPMPALASVSATLPASELRTA